MKACVLESIGNLVYKEVPTPRPQKGEVLLKIHACGICSSDIDRVFKTGTYHFPTIPGHEFAGEIVEVGDDVPQTLINKRAAVFPLLPCFHCAQCEQGAYVRCENYNYFGSRCDGGFAEYIAVPQWNLVLFPDSLPYSTAALCEPASVALHAISSVSITPHDTIVISGNGTIGLLAAMWAQIRGAGNIVIIGRGHDKVHFAKQLGFSHAISTLDTDPVNYVRELTAGQGATCAFEFVGSSQSISTVFQTVKKGGNVVLTGNPISDIILERNSYWKILRNELNIHGTWNSSYNQTQNDWQVALQALEKGNLNANALITHTFALNDCIAAFETLRNKKENTIKVMFNI